MRIDREIFIIIVTIKLLKEPAKSFQRNTQVALHSTITDLENSFHCRGWNYYNFLKTSLEAVKMSLCQFSVWQNSFCVINILEELCFFFTNNNNNIISVIRFISTLIFDGLWLQEFQPQLWTNVETEDHPDSHLLISTVKINSQLQGH